jgi:diaminohydroxyphosphoribosylaminopyrimidine deaminase/5-amino-6-(5-phosphoribosylamino)uracil reductase
MKEDHDGEHRAPDALKPRLRGFLMADDSYMDEAFALAEQGRGLTHPNPLVGAVVVRDDEVIGRGFHRGPGEPHAEVVALGEAGERAVGASLYCTLEPCSHHGRTPPCADAIIAAGVARVVVAWHDPNPLVNGRGLAKLEESGVVVDLREEEYGRRALRQNAAFLKFHETGLPLLTYKAALSLDGKVAAAGGDARWISCLESRRIVHQLRAATDAVVVGAGTVRRDDPELTVRLGDGRNPVRIVVSRSGDVPPSAKVFDTAAARTILLCEQLDEQVAPLLADRGVELVETGPSGLADGLRELADGGLLDLLCEGGPTLGASLLAEGLIDHVALFVAPMVVGSGAPELFATPAVSALPAAWRIDQVEWRQVCDDLLLTGRLIYRGP